MRDIEATFTDEAGRCVLTNSAASAVCERLWDEYQAFAQRDLGKLDIVYLFLDGMAERLHLVQPREAVLAAWVGLLGLPWHTRLPAVVQRRERQVHDHAIWTGRTGRRRDPGEALLLSEWAIDGGKRVHTEFRAAGERLAAQLIQSAMADSV